MLKTTGSVLLVGTVALLSAVSTGCGGLVAPQDGAGGEAGVATGSSSGSSSSGSGSGGSGSGSGSSSGGPATEYSVVCPAAAPVLQQANPCGPGYYLLEHGSVGDGGGYPLDDVSLTGTDCECIPEAEACASECAYGPCSCPACGSQTAFVYYDAFYGNVTTVVCIQP